MYPPKNRQGNNLPRHQRTVSFPIVYGIICIGIGLIILAMTYGPLLIQECRFLFGHDGNAIVSNTSIASDKTSRVIQPVDEQFGIVIPKINANASVIENVDPFDAHAYQLALTKGVAHAKGTSLPGSPGNIFIFSHSSSNFYDALHYNSVFYLLPKLQQGDLIYIFFRKEKFTYQVQTKTFISPDDVSYLSLINTDETLTLMTCWPPGTTIQRLIIRSVRVL